MPDSVEHRLEQYLNRLKEQGFRLTTQRRIIIEALLSNLGEHLNARQLLSLVQTKDPTVGFATVYRTLELLVDMGLLNQMSLAEGFSRYEVPDDKMHFHVYCRFCGNTIHLPDEKQKEDTVRQWVGETPFDLVPQTFEIAGICHECKVCIETGEEPAIPCTGCRRRQGRVRVRGGGHGRNS
jgi:Fur family ferric uptake transcriptional regulator